MPPLKLLLEQLDWILALLNLSVTYLQSLDLSLKVKVKSLSHVRLFATLWTIAYQASPSMGFSRQEYWSGLPFPSPRERLGVPKQEEERTRESEMDWGKEGDE